PSARASAAQKTSATAAAYKNFFIRTLFLACPRRRTAGHGGKSGIARTLRPIVRFAARRLRVIRRAPTLKEIKRRNRPDSQRLAPRNFPVPADDRRRANVRANVAPNAVSIFDAVSAS